MMLFTNVERNESRAQKIFLVGFINDFLAEGKMSNSRLCTASESWTSKMEKLSKARDKSARQQVDSSLKVEKFITIHMAQCKFRGRAGSHFVSYNQFYIKYN